MTKCSECGHERKTLYSRLKDFISRNCDDYGSQLKRDGYLIRLHPDDMAEVFGGGSPTEIAGLAAYGYYLGVKLQSDAAVTKGHIELHELKVLEEF